MSLNAECWLAEKLIKIGAAKLDLLAGLTDQAERKRRLRETILGNALSHELCGRRRGKWQSFAEVFQRLYGEPLDGVKSNTVQTDLVQQIDNRPFDDAIPF